VAQCNYLQAQAQRGSLCETAKRIQRAWQRGLHLGTPERPIQFAPGFSYLEYGHECRMVNLGFTRIKCEYCLYLHVTKTSTGIHIDNFLSAASSEASIFKQQLSLNWKISDLGESQFCVGIVIECDLTNHYIYLSQTALIDKILDQFNMSNSNPASTPMESGLVLSHHSDTVLMQVEELELQQLPYQCMVGFHLARNYSCCPETIPVHGVLQSQPLGCHQTCVKIPQGHFESMPKTWRLCCHKFGWLL
jgi:hypothetical protein